MPKAPSPSLSTKQLLQALHDKGHTLVTYNIDYLVRIGKLSPEFDRKGQRLYSPEAVDQVIEILANRRRKESA